jgi:hypothetical protein
MHATFPANLTFPDSITLIIFDEVLFIMQFSPVSCIFFLLRSRHYSRYPVLEHLLHVPTAMRGTDF